MPLAQTRAWNWQQGCMLQWLGPEHESLIIYNDRMDGRFVSIMHDLNEGQKRVYDLPVYAVSSCGSKALCVDNERLFWFRKGYSYEGVRNERKNVKMDPDDGIWLLDLVTGEITQIVWIGDLIENAKLDNMDGAIHYVEHIMFSPNGKRFQFLHRWIIPDGGIYTRLYVANIDGKNAKILNDSGRMTHCCWRDDETVLGWGSVPNAVSNMRKNKILSTFVFKPLMPIYRMIAKGDSISGNSAISQLVTGDGYLSIDANSGKTQRVLHSTLKRDGHPTVFRKNRDLFITDTYANDDGVLDLLLCSINEPSAHEVAHLRSISRYDSTGLRCDLHPKLSFDEASIAIDTMHDGCRSIYLYSINN